MRLHKNILRDIHSIIVNETRLNGRLLPPSIQFKWLDLVSHNDISFQKYRRNLIEKPINKKITHLNFEFNEIQENVIFWTVADNR